MTLLKVAMEDVSILERDGSNEDVAGSVQRIGGLRIEPNQVSELVMC